MINKEDLYTGYKTKAGVKVYLGDHLVGPHYFPMLIQYDFKTNDFVITTKGKNKSLYRIYPIQNVSGLDSLRVISNSIFHQSVKVNDLVKITVQNIKDSVFVAGDIVRVIQVNEWDIVVQSSQDQILKATIQYHEFLEMWRFED